MRSDVHPVVGVWRLLSFETRSSSGKTTYPFGPDAVGTLVYTDAGVVAATVSARDRPHFVVADAQRGAPEEYAAAGRAYIGYVADYTLDDEAGTVAHRFRQATFPNWEGTTQTRYFDLSEDDYRLELSTDPQEFGGHTVVGALVWEREA